MKQIWSRIKSRRMEINLSAAELAERLKMSKATIHRYENGEITNIKLPVVESLARELRCNPGWLVGKSDRKEAAQDIVGNHRFADISVVIRDVIEFVEHGDGLTWEEARLSDEKRSAIVSGLKIIREMANKN